MDHFAVPILLPELVKTTGSAASMVAKEKVCLSLRFWENAEVFEFWLYPTLLYLLHFPFFVLIVEVFMKFSGLGAFLSSESDAKVCEWTAGQRTWLGEHRVKSPCQRKIQTTRCLNQFLSLLVSTATWSRIRLTTIAIRSMGKWSLKFMNLEHQMTMSNV